ncbi:hypothetical protein SAMN04489740_2673 [Arthrobacter alpinus]|uniref:Uncharacterized protein n=1 Tax=Arthrobacter alpinus TaxID=656366 RepID=A0A1H5LYK7_9MICC|nr:hypothetical protein [Arthrobacter alpinus]SEE82149.1 hypothetical protein SAMN04489740_2673 [Arthrobacter alpinus]
MVNLLIPYAGPNGGLTVLASKLRKVYGNPARTYEFVTGYKSAGNVSGHNADANGQAHAMDIFVGPGNLTEAQGIDLAERLRAEGKRGSIPGHPDRLAYIIHRGRIAGDHTGWEWVAYTGTDWHGDHIHVSAVFDYYWGDAVAGNPADYNSPADWDLWESEFQPANPQSGNITPIKEEGFLMALTDKQQEDIYAELCTPWGRGDRVKRVVDEVMSRPMTSAGAMKGRKTSLGLMIAWNDDHVIQVLAAVAAAAASDGATVDQIKDAVKASIAESVVKVDVTVAGGDK